MQEQRSVTRQTNAVLRADVGATLVATGRLPKVGALGEATPTTQLPISIVLGFNLFARTCKRQ